jgi:hypothetical protein
MQIDTHSLEDFSQRQHKQQWVWLDASYSATCAGMFGSDKAQAAERQTEADSGDAEDAGVTDTELQGIAEEQR